VELEVVLPLDEHAASAMAAANTLTIAPRRTDRKAGVVM
jgi:hypothetical protein